MKKWIKAVAFSLALILTIPVTVPQCNQTVVQAATKKPKLNVKNNKKTLYVGDKFKIKVTNYEDKFKWTSSNKKVATVDKNGVIKAKKAGIATISTTKDQYWIYCTVIVKDNKPKFSKKEAKKNIKITPVESCYGLYEITSSYIYPTEVRVEYNVTSRGGLRVTNGQEDVLAISSSKTYFRLPIENYAEDDGYSVTIEYSEYIPRAFSRDISYFENNIKAVNVFHELEEEKYTVKEKIGDEQIEVEKTKYIYKVCIKNISDKKIELNGDFVIVAKDKDGKIIESFIYGSAGKIYSKEYVKALSFVRYEKSIDSFEIYYTNFY